MELRLNIDYSLNYRLNIALQSSQEHELGPQSLFLCFMCIQMLIMQSSKITSFLFYNQNFFFSFSKSQFKFHFVITICKTFFNHILTSKINPSIYHSNMFIHKNVFFLTNLYNGRENFSQIKVKRIITNNNNKYHPVNILYFSYIFR